MDPIADVILILLFLWATVAVVRKRSRPKGGA
jgi:hypothetical protein